MLRPYPVSVGSYLRYGLVQPVCQWADGSITSNSFAIMAKILGNHNESPDVSHRFHSNVLRCVLGNNLSKFAAYRDQVELEKLFISYVTTRVQSPLAFLHGFAEMRDIPQGKRLAYQCREK